MKPTNIIGLIAFASFSASTPAIAKDMPDATASFTGQTVAVGVGFTWGKGVLTFKGKRYPFKVDGISAIGAGVTKIVGTGTVYHLKTPADFGGTYGAAGGGASVGDHGKASASLKNDKDVVIEFHAREKGVSVNLDLSGVHIKMRHM